MGDQEPATLMQIAAEAGLSVTTVSKILRGSYKGNTRKGRSRVAVVSELAQRLGYIANGAARRLRDGRHRAVAVLVPTDPFGHPETISSEYITGIAASLRASLHTILIHTYPREQTDIAVRLLHDRNFDAVAVLEDCSPELDRFLANAAIPAVHLNVPAAPGRVVMVRDEYAAARSVVEVVTGLGYRRFLVLGGRSGHFSYPLRADGIRDAAQAAGATCTYCDLPSWDGRFRAAVEGAGLDPGTVVLCTDSSTVLRSLRWLPPRQPIACCDDAHLFIHAMPWLTRARFDRAQLGRRAADILLQRLNDPQAALPDLTPLAGPVLVGDSTPALAMGR